MGPTAPDTIDWSTQVDEIGPALYRYFLGSSFPPATAADLVQETLVRLLSKTRAGAYRPELGSLRMLAFGIARFVRLEEARFAASTEELHPSPADFDDRVVDGAAEQDARLQGAALRRAIAKLEDPEREILLLLIDRDLTLDEVGTLLHLPVGTVKSHVHRAKNRIREALNERSIRS